MSHNTATELNWQTWLVKGDQYLRASKPGSNANRFGTEIVYNLLSMSLESYIMAVLDINHALPENHTYTDLFDALDLVMKVDSGLKSRILKYENIQSICSVDKYSTRKPSDLEIADLKDALVEFSGIAHAVCQA